MWMMYGRRARYVLPSLQPGLDVKMNVNKRQEFCAKSGIDFVMPQTVGVPNMQQPSSMVNPYGPPPAYPGTSAPYPPSNQYGMQQV